MAATRRGYALPVQGRPTAITTVRVREDPADIDSYIEKAVMYIKGQLDKSWVYVRVEICSFSNIWVQKDRQKRTDRAT